MRHACSQSLALSSALQQCAGRLAQAATHPLTLALSGFVDSLPALNPAGGNRLTQAQVEAFAGLYYYGELETVQLLAVAELIVEERYTLNLNDRGLFQALENMADAMERGWYDEQRRAQLFSTALGFETGGDIRNKLATVTDALLRYEQNLRYPNSSPGLATSVKFAMAALLDEIRRRGFLGVERASSQLNGQLRSAITILGNSSLQRLFSARDIWGLVGAIIGGAGGQTPAFTETSTRAQTGAAIIGWIAGHIDEIRDDDGPLASRLRNDASLFRYAAQWQQAAQQFLGSSSTANPTGAWQNPPSQYQSPGYNRGWA